MQTLTDLFIAHALSCAFLTGLIWTIQLVHYPSFRFVRTDQFSEFHQLHTKKITYIVAPAMIFEAATGLLLLIQLPSNIILWMNVFGLLSIWACTFFLSVPIHNSLLHSSRSEQIEKLIFTNWPRTLLWTIRLILLIFFYRSLV